MDPPAPRRPVVRGPAWRARVAGTRREPQVRAEATAATWNLFVSNWGLLGVRGSGPRATPATAPTYPGPSSLGTVGLTGTELVRVSRFAEAYLGFIGARECARAAPGRATSSPPRNTAPMSTHSFDAIVVGAGPAGTSASWHLKHRGVERVLLLDKASFPRDKPCGSALTRKAQRYLEHMGLLDRVREQAYQIPQTYVVTPRGKIFTEVSASHKRPSMMVLNRRELDHTMLLHVRRAGVEVREGVEVQSLVDEDGEGTTVVLKSGERLRTRTVVMASGAHSRKFIEGDPDHEKIGAFVGWFRGRQVEEHAAYMFYDEVFLPLYGWIFPESENLVNVGVALEDDQCSGKTLRDGFAHVRDTYLDRVLQDAEPADKPRGFPINYSYRVQTVVQGNVLFVGEAARLVEPMTGEGIAQAMMSGRLAAEAIAEYVATGDRARLAAYEPTVRHKYRGFRSTRWMKKLMSRRAGWSVIEPVVGRLGRWRNVGTW